MSGKAVLTVGISHDAGRWWITTGGGNSTFEDARDICSEFIKLARQVYADDKEWDTFGYFMCENKTHENFVTGGVVQWYTKMISEDVALCARRRRSFTVALGLVQEKLGHG